jgi:tetratricopeptide (TPR) repeat protein
VIAMLWMWILLFFPALGSQAPAEQARQTARRGYELLLQGKLEAAENELRRAVNLAPREPLALATLGMVLVQRSQLEEGAKYFERALAIDEADTGTRYNLAAVLVRLGRTKEAAQHLRRILRQEPKHPQAAGLLAALQPTVEYEAALEHYRAGRYHESQAILERLSGSGDPEPRVYSLLAWCHHRQGRREAAEEAIRQAIAAAPSEATWYAHGAQILLEAGDYQAAYRMALEALARQPRSAPALKLRGRIELDRGAPRQALESLTKAVEAEPADPEAQLWLGLAQKALRQYEAAAATFEQGLARYPDFAPFYAAYAELLLEPELRSRPLSESRARALLEKAVALDGTLSQARYELGKLLLDSGDAEHALPHLEEAARQAPAVSRFRLALAEAYRLLGRRREQREQLNVFRKLIATEQKLR